MIQYIIATFEDGVFKPHEKFPLPAGTTVQLMVMPCNDACVEDEALAELDRLCDEEPIDAGGARLTRDQLHERP